MTEKYYYSPSIRDYIKQDFERFGYQFDTVKDIKTNLDKNLILYENDIKFCIDNIESFNISNKFSMKNTFDSIFKFWTKESSIIEINLAILGR